MTEDAIRVAVTYRVCQGWRLPMFAKLSAAPGVDLKIFHGADVPGTKLVNARDFGAVRHVALKTWHASVRSTGRSVPAVFHPGVAAELSRFNPHVILCEGGSNIFTNCLVMGWARLRGVPTIWWSLGEIPGRRFTGLSRIYKWLSDLLTRNATVLLGYSSRAKAFFESIGCTQPTFVAVNCVDTDRVLARVEADRAEAGKVRADLGLDGKKVLLFVGALTAPKRIDLLLGAFRRVREAGNAVALVVVGDGPERQRLQGMARDEGLSDVHFVGEVIDGVGRYFEAADLFVLPGLGGLAISEAMCHALPVVCTVADGCEVDLITDWKNGVVFREGDEDSLASVLEKLVRPETDLARMGADSLERIHRSYNARTYIEQVTAAVRCARELGLARRKAPAKDQR